MSTIVKRPYHSPLRRAQAVETRNRILDAALRLFAGQGYGATTIAAIATEAGVVPETVYATFRSKRGIIDGLSQRAAPEGLVESLRDAWTERSGDPAAQLAYIAGFATDFWGPNEDLAEVFRHGTGDAEISEIWSDLQASRRKLFDDLVGRWPGGVLRAGVTRSQAADIVWALASPDLFHLLVRERGWPVKRYRSWLADSLQSAVLAGSA
jgi:AcrR family transcriptional regulator